MDDLIYGMYIDHHIGYGAFAKKELKKGKIIG